MAKAGVPGWQATAGLSPQPCHSAPLGHGASHPHPLIRNWGYVCKPLWQRGLHLVTSIRRNMKNYLMPLLDKLLLRKRFIIETLFNKLKSGMGTAHQTPFPH